MRYDDYNLAVEIANDTLKNAERTQVDRVFLTRIVGESEIARRMNYEDDEC